MPRNTRAKMKNVEAKTQSRAGYDIVANQLADWAKTGLDFCTSCLSEKLALVCGFYDDESYIRCTTCGTRQV